MKIAFLTPEFVTEYGFGGGLGNYLNRFTKELVKRGHDVEVFVSSQQAAGTLDHQGVVVHRVPHAFRHRLNLPLKWGARLFGFGASYDLQVRAWRLAQALEARHRKQPFEVVQCADYLAVGLYVRRKPERKFIVRCSSAADLYNEATGSASASEKARERLEIESVRRAERAYAPSRFIAEHLATSHGLQVSVIRPPYAFEVTAAPAAIDTLPQRYFLHFGQLSRLKGTDWLIRSLKIAFRQAPDMRVVMVGVTQVAELNQWLEQLGADRAKVLALYPVSKAVLYGILDAADAAIIPSRADNLPNTLLESLMHRLPVIGTDGVSIDELVVDGVNGVLVPKDDDDALANAMVRVWQGVQKLPHRGFLDDCGVTAQFEPSKAIDSFLDFVQAC